MDKGRRGWFERNVIGGEERKTVTTAGMGEGGGEGGVMVMHEVTHVFLNPPAGKFLVHATHQWHRRPG